MYVTISNTFEIAVNFSDWPTMNQALRVSLLSLVSCLCISALLMSPALAQVNGPGPSPSSLFDTVLNLPGDEAVITGVDGNANVDGESIGGVPGQTTQLNVSDGGNVGAFFDANSDSEVNISCLLYTSPSPRDKRQPRMLSSA